MMEGPTWGDHITPEQLVYLVAVLIPTIPAVLSFIQTRYNAKMNKTHTQPKLDQIASNVNGKLSTLLEELSWAHDENARLQIEIEHLKWQLRSHTKEDKEPENG